MWMVVLFLLLISIVLWIVGSQKKGIKGQRSLSWFTAYIVGIIFTILLALPFTMGFFGGVVQGYTNAQTRAKAEALSNLAEKNKDIGLAEKAVAYAKQNLETEPTGYFAAKNYQVYKQAEQVLQSLQNPANK